jgi:hypothetical protein
MTIVNDIMKLLPWMTLQDKLRALQLLEFITNEKDLSILNGRPHVFHLTNGCRFVVQFLDGTKSSITNQNTAAAA